MDMLNGKLKIKNINLVFSILIYMLAIGKMLNKILKYHFSCKNNYSCRYLVKIPKPYITLFITMTFFSLVFFFF
jgi:hypothetical protein